jgi:hypothetical protein
MCNVLWREQLSTAFMTFTSPRSELTLGSNVRRKLFTRPRNFARQKRGPISVSDSKVWLRRGEFERRGREAADLGHRGTGALSNYHLSLLPRMLRHLSFFRSERSGILRSGRALDAADRRAWCSRQPSASPAGERRQTDRRLTLIPAGPCLLSPSIPAGSLSEPPFTLHVLTAALRVRRWARNVTSHPKWRPQRRWNAQLATM